MVESSTEKISQKLDSLSSLVARMAAHMDELSAEITKVSGQMEVLLESLDEDLEEPLVTLDGEFTGMDRDLTEEL